MRNFSLKVGNVPMMFDTDGRVLDSADKVKGQWNTTPANKILFTKAEGGSEEIDVAWTFNADNQLVISQSGKAVFTVVESTDGLPRFQLKKNRLVVDPDGDGDFEFTLNCLFGLTAEGNLVLSINGKESVLDGFIEDSKSRLRFQFKDKATDAFPNSLVLSGKWERRADVTDAIRLHFVLDDPTLEIAAKPLHLPQALRVDPLRNHLALVYEKNGKERRLQFLGSLEIKPNFTLVFRIDDVTDGSVRKSSITVESSFEFDRFQGQLTLFVGREKTPTSQKLQVSAKLAAVLKNNATLEWSVDYTKSTAGGTASTTFATALRFEAEGQKFFVSYQQAGKARRLEVTAKIEKEDFTISGGVEITNDGQGRRLKAFIGVAF